MFYVSLAKADHIWKCWPPSSCHKRNNSSSLSQTTQAISTSSNLIPKVTIQNHTISTLFIKLTLLCTDPKSLSGQRLLHRSTFHTGHNPTSMLLLPSTTPPTATQPNDPNNPPTLTTTPPSSILLPTASGALALLTPLDESTYRRLVALQTHLSTILEHACGLNPRAFRAVESEGFGGRGILDGLVLRRWRELSSQKKIEACKRVGEEVEVVRAWLREVEGGGLVYL